MIIIPEDVLRIAEALSAPIDELGLSVRSYNGLRRWGITTVADVYRAYQDKQLSRIRNIGEKSVIEIEKHLEEHLAKVAPANTSEIPNSSDTISRQAAIEVIDSFNVFESRCDQIKLEQMIGELPPAQPEQLSTNLAEVGTDCISRQAALDIFDDYNVAVENGQIEAYSRDRKRLCDLPPAQPERTCVNCGRTANNGGWYADGGTRCPIEEHYALPKDGYCHLWEKRNVTDDDYTERREE